MGGAGTDDGVESTTTSSPWSGWRSETRASGADGIEVSNVAAAEPDRAPLQPDPRPGSAGIQIQDADTDLLAYNNIAYGLSRGFDWVNGTNATAASDVLNNTVYLCSSDCYRSLTGCPNVTAAQQHREHSAGGGTTTSSAWPPRAATTSPATPPATTHSPAGGGINDVPLASLNFVSVTPVAENLHITAGSAAQNVGVNLSSILSVDIDGALRRVPWDIGADDISATTAVELLSFTARGTLGPTGTGAIELSWETASELDNLGFHLYRSSSEARTVRADHGILDSGPGQLACGSAVLRGSTRR